MKRFVLALLAACGGGPSIDVSTPTAVIVSSSCTRTSASSFTAQFELQVTLQIGQAIAPEISFFGGGFDSFFDEFLGCGGWQPFGNDTCVREIGLAPTVTVVKSRNHNNGSEPLPIPVTISINATPLDAPGSFGIGNSAFDEVTCQ